MDLAKGLGEFRPLAFSGFGPPHAMTTAIADHVPPTFDLAQLKHATAQVHARVEAASDAKAMHGIIDGAERTFDVLERWLRRP